MVWGILIIGFIYVMTGIIDHCINIYKYFNEKKKDDVYEEYKKRLNG